ncbi:sugar ABC transporter permease [Streptomyces sp. NPDC005828]|uniref:sugar ABC transporter permease n=1 Tax=Streptomyces sp. NPDC005828 TaxID=3157071 RepID=UPI0033E45CE1
MTAGDWADEALGLLCLRVGETAGQVGERFPLYADPDDGHWTTTGRGSWTGGFWAGLLWLRARHTGSGADRRAAVATTARLGAWADADTATRGLILWYGTALADEKGDEGEEGEEGEEGDEGESAREAAGALRERAAKAVLAAFDPALGLVPWGSALGGARLRARADGVPGLVPLLATAGPEGQAAAAAHLHRHLDLCLPRAAARRPRPAWCREASGWTADADPAPGWTRGEAWLLLAVADALVLARPAASTDGQAHAPVRYRGPDRLTEAAELLLESCAFLTGPLVPPAEAHHPDGPYDTSAAAVAAVALLKLAQVPGARWASACGARAQAVLHRLVTGHLTRPGGCRPAGMLLDGCYDARSGTAVRHELVWGDFFLALGLAGHLGRVDLRRV